MSKQLAQLIQNQHITVGEHDLFRGSNENINCESCNVQYDIPEAVRQASPQKRALFELYIYGVFQQFGCGADPSDVPDSCTLPDEPYPDKSIVVEIDESINLPTGETETFKGYQHIHNYTRNRGRAWSKAQR